MNDLIVIGIDPGLANFGLSAARLNKSDIEPILMDVLVTTKSDKKLKVLVSDDNDRRGDELSKMFQEHLLRLEQVGTIVAFAVEATSYPRSSSAAAKTAISRGIVIGEAARRNIPLISCRPQEMKDYLCGRKNASKQDVKDALCQKFSSVSDMVSGINEGKHEHCFDALGAIDLGSTSPIISAIRRLL